MRGHLKIENEKYFIKYVQKFNVFEEINIQETQKFTCKNTSLFTS